MEISFLMKDQILNCESYKGENQNCKLGGAYNDFLQIKKLDQHTKFQLAASVYNIFMP